MKEIVTIQLRDPDELSVENAYRSLPRVGEILLETSLSGLCSQLEKLENAGFAGLRIKAFRSANENITVRAFKGKQGNCYNTGRVASYLGAARAALDDDHHLLLAGEEIPVCEKTSILYSLPSYSDLIHCSEADRELFEGDNFEDSLENLFAMIRGEKQAEEFTDLFYPGPFKLLVLGEGTIVHRGRVNKVPVGEAKKLIKEDGLFRMDGQLAGPHESYIENFRNDGPRCLLRKTQDNIVIPQNQAPDLSQLPGISRDLRNRMLSVIEGGKDYFILTGSNREDEFGCCPSDEVTLADNLVRAGILSASREVAAADSCPLTVYAFRYEIENNMGNLQFNQDHHFRMEVLSRLKNNRLRNLKIVTRWTLLVFVAVTLILAVIRLSGTEESFSGTPLYEQLDVSRPDGTVVVLFHYSQRCDQCRAMERLAGEVLNDEFSWMTQRRGLEFRRVLMDREENKSLMKRLGLFTSTLVIIRFEGGEEEDVRVLERSWSLYNNELEFKEMLTEELKQMISAE